MKKDPAEKAIVNLGRFIWTALILLSTFYLTTMAYSRGIKIAEYAKTKGSDNGSIWWEDMTNFSDFSLISWVFIIMLLVGSLWLFSNSKQEEEK